jgi:hypothetical protein
MLQAFAITYKRGPRSKPHTGIQFHVDQATAERSGRAMVEREFFGKGMFLSAAPTEDPRNVAPQNAWPRQGSL